MVHNTDNDGFQNVTKNAMHCCEAPKALMKCKETLEISHTTDVKLITYSFFLKMRPRTRCNWLSRAWHYSLQYLLDPLQKQNHGSGAETNALSLLQLVAVMTTNPKIAYDSTRYPSIVNSSKAVLRLPIQIINIQTKPQA